MHILFDGTAVKMIFVSCLMQAEARLAAKRAARAEAREIRMKELERQQKEVSPTEQTERQVAFEIPV